MALSEGPNVTSVGGNVSGTITLRSPLVSAVATGTAPLTIASTTAVTNLNADYLDGQHGSYYMPASTTSFKEITVINDAVGDVPLIISAINGTTAHLQDWKVNGVSKASIDKDGNASFNNLTVSGTTTTVNTEEVNIADNIIRLNSNYTGSTPTDGGIEIERGTLANTSII